MAGVDANLMREYEAYKDASKEELDEYLSKLPPSKRQAYLDYAAKMEAKKAAKEEKKKKESQGQLGCLIAVLVFAAIIGITAYFQENEDKKEAPAPPKAVEQQESKSESKSAAAVVSPESDSDSKNDDAKLKEMKKMEVARWSESTNSQLKAVDEGFKNIWNMLLASISDGNKDKAKTRQNIEDFAKKLDEIKESLKNQKFSEHLTSDERDKLKEANEGYIEWINERKDAAEELKNLAESDIPPEKLKQIEDALKKSDEQLFKTKSAVEEFQKGLGY